MDTSWNLCAPALQPIILTKNHNSMSNDGPMVMTPLMLDALNSSPNSIENEKQFMIPQRRASGSYDSGYLNSHQYSVQGSTSTPNSVGPSSGTASPESTQLTSDSTSFTHCIDSNSLNAKWIDRPSLNLDNCSSNKSPRYCYVFQQPNGSISTMSDSASIVSSNSTAHSTITVPVSTIMPHSASFTQPTQTLVKVGSPFQTHSLPAPSNPSPIERASSVPLQYSMKEEFEVKTTDFSSLNSNSNISPDNESKSKKAKKRKASVSGDSNQTAKKQVPNRENNNRSTTKPTISALTRRRLKTAENSGKTLEKMHLLLTELTVEDLKIICRKYNLPISGTKSDLLRRLQPIEDQIDVEAILLSAMEEEDLRESVEKSATKSIDIDSNKNFISTKPISTLNSTIPTVKIPVNSSNTNQFDLAISNYLLQHRKQINQQTLVKSSTECTESGCSCMQNKNGTFPTAKTIYFAPSTTTTVMNGSGPKTTVIRVPIANFNSTLDNSASSVLSKKICKLDSSQCNGAATFSYYAEMGSGGQFTLETSPSAKNNAGPPTSNLPKFLQISVPSTLCANVKEAQNLSCLKCKDKQPVNESGNDELQALINELSLGQINNGIENSSLTAKILALHQHTIKAQYSKLYEMGKVIGDSQKVLQCQQSKIETARKAVAKIKANKPNAIDTILQKLDVPQLNEQHNQQTNELKTIQQNHQQLKADQEKLTKSVMDIQEQIHVEQAVEDIVRLIKGNRKAALLIVQLVHKFQCDRMREINRFGPKKQENKPITCTECNAEPNQPCNCAKNAQLKEQKPAVVVIDESDDESSQKSENDKQIKSTKNPTKKKSKSANKRSNKPVSQRSEHTFNEVMEDIFMTVLSSDGSTNDSTKENTVTNSNESSNAHSNEYQHENNSKSKVKSVLKSSATNSPSLTNASTPSMFTKSPTEKADEHKSETNFMLNVLHSNDHNMNLACQQISPEQPMFNNNISDPIIGQQQNLMMETSPSFVTPNEHQFQAPAMYNYISSVAKSEISYTNGYSQQYSESRLNSSAYHQRRVFLQQKRQTLYEQLEQIERQQLHNEMQNSSYMCNSIDINDEELANLSDLNVEDLCSNYDFDQLDVPPTPIDENPPNAPSFNCQQPPQYLSPYPNQFQNHSHLNSGYHPTTEQQQPLIQQHPQQQQSRYSATFQQQHANSTDFEDILELICNGEKNRQSSNDFEDGIQATNATNAIYQELRLNDIDEMNWNNQISEENKLEVNEN